MSELLVAPSTTQSIDWLSIANVWTNRLSAQLRNEVGPSPALRYLGSHAIVDPQQALSPRMNCYIDVGQETTLGFSINSNDAIALDERSFIEDYGWNLDEARIELAVDKWRQSGYAFWLSSGGSDRPPWELWAMVKIAAGIADITDGSVISMDTHPFDLGVGVFTPLEFDSAKPVPPQ